MWFTGLQIRDLYFTVNYDIQQGDTERLPEVNELLIVVKIVCYPVANASC